MKKGNKLFKIKDGFIMIGMAVLLNFLILPAAAQISAQVSPKKESKGAIKISLDDVMSLALENSLDIQIAKYDAYIKRTSLKKAESIFDTILEAELGFSRDRSMQPTIFAGSEEKKHNFSVGLEKKIPSGTTINLETAAEKARTDSSYATLNPYNEATAKISIKQALGKNFFGLADRGDIKITKIDIENSDFTSLDDIEESLYSVEKAYWNFVLKDRHLSVAEDMLERAKKLWSIYKDKYTLGLIEEVELLTMEALVLTRESDVFIAKMNKDAAKNNLLFLINQGDFQQDLIALDRLPHEEGAVNLPEALKEAIENRRDYKRIKNELEMNKIDIVIKKNALWPEIDLGASFARNNIDSSREDAWGDLSKNSNDDVSVTLKFKFPLENRQAKSELRSAQLEKAKLLLELKQVERSVLRELNDKVNQVNTVQKQVRILESTLDMHRKKLDEQIKRLNYGRSNSDTLIRYEEDLLQAQLALSEYLYQYRICRLELELAKNSLFERYWKEPL
ncbi:MAG: hypothetical protein DRP74_00755 [Candidatus Omnitrophota bacterium]|nr:MAG: hypothetical protein DRP74_00755 [Candidatus Omnitrophota bacterium]